MCQLVLGDMPKPIILVDWSGLTRCGEYHFLRASVAVGGRSLTLWESTYPEKAYMGQHTHREFIHMLKHLLPKGCCPIIVTDAGFRCPWFKLIQEQGWDFVGRARHNTLYRQEGMNTWEPVKALYSTAKYRARYLFCASLAKVNPVNCYFYSFKASPKQRQKTNLRGKKIQCSVSLKHAKGGREPWLLVSSLSPTAYTPQSIVHFYKKRMQIEESFRDLKNTRQGFGLRHCRSMGIDRLNIALLLGAIGFFLLWIIGIAAKRKNIHYQFQSNTQKERCVLSAFTVGWQYIMAGMRPLLWDEVHVTIQQIQAAARQ